MLAWSRTHGRSFPWRERRDPYAILIGEVLLQRTRGENVAPVYDEFLGRWPEPANLARARESSIASVIRPLGLAKRAPMLRDLGRALVSRGSTQLTDPAELLSLPGVGPYTAHAVLVFAMDRTLPLVDWVIARVLRRYFGLKESRRPNADGELWALAARLARPSRARDLWLATLDFAAAVCRPTPICAGCPLESSCAYVAPAEVMAPTPRIARG